jgi:elongation factor G
MRNLVLLGHGNSGKTALVDALALQTKVTNRHGDSADGTSISNTEPEEKERKQTLTSHVFQLPLEGVRLNLIDTPGHADFIADAISAFQVVETGLLCVSATGGVTFHTRRLWAAAGKAGLGRAIVVTHPDGENAKFEETLADLNSVFGDVVVPVTYPDANGPAFSAIHNVLDGDGPDADTYREKLEERVAEADDAVLETYLDSGEMSREDLEKHFARAVVKGTLVPLFTVCPPKQKGMQKLCSFITQDLPSPAEFGGRNAAEAGSDSYGLLVEPDESGPFAAKVFKVVVDPYVGRMSYARCFRGTLKTEDTFLNVRTGRTEKAGSLLGIKGAETAHVDSVAAGDIFVVSKLETLSLWDTITVDSSPISFPPAEYPEPTYALAVTPKARGDEQKINEGLEKLAAEDPTFQVTRAAQTAELIVSGLSPLHLDVQLARLLRRYGVDTARSLPKVPYRETITTRAEGHHRHKKQTGGRGQFAEVYLRVATKARGEGFEFIDKVVGGSVPRNFIPEVEKGIKKFLAAGALAGFPVVDCSAELYDGKFHQVDSDQLSFQLAGERGFLDGFNKAKPILLEPIMDVEIQVPERFTGDVAGNLSSLRGRMQGMEVVEGIQVIRAQVPLKEMQDYSTQLRSITAGEGTFTMSMSRYEPVPGNLQSEIIKAHKKAAEADK